MRKWCLNLLLGALMVAIGGSFNGAEALLADEVRSGNIAEADNVSGQDTNSGTGVKTGHIQNRAVTRSKMAGVFAVRVECNGECSDSTLGQICDGLLAGWEPIAVSCDSTQDASGYNCGGDNQCSNYAVTRAMRLGDYCIDTGGGDAIVFCMPAQ